MMKSISASDFMSSGVARKTGECSQVKVSPELTSWPKTWLEEVAQRSVEKARHCGPFTFRELWDVLAGEADSRLMIGLRAKLGVVSGSPVGNLLQVVLIDQFGQGLAVIVADGVGLRRSSGDQFGQVRNQVIPATLLELLRQLRRPISAEGLQRIREDGIRRSIAEGLEQRLAHLIEVLGDGFMGVGVEYPALSIDGGALDLPGRVWLWMKKTATRGLSEAAKLAELPVTEIGLAVAAS